MRWLLVSVLISCSSADSSNTDQLTNSAQTSSQLFKFCSDAHSLKSCLKIRSLMLLEDITLKNAPIRLFRDSLLLVKNKDARRRMMPLTLKDLDSSLPEDEEAKEETLDNLISSALIKFIQTRALQIRLPDFIFWGNQTSVDEGRKKKGGGGAGWMLLFGGGMMGALALGAVALMAGKALIISLMALMLAGLSVMRKGGEGGGHAATTYEVINVPTGHGHRRSLSLHPGSLVAGDLAYRGYRGESSSVKR